MKEKSARGLEEKAGVVGRSCEKLGALARSELEPHGSRCYLYPTPLLPWTPHVPPSLLLAMSVAADGLNDIYDALERYDWDDDIEFQAGLQAILGSNSTPEQATELALRARCFYYARYVCYNTALSVVICEMAD